MESEAELKRKVTRDSFIMFDSMGHEFSISWRIHVRAENFKIPFEDLPNNLRRPKETKAYNEYWNCVSIARLKHGI